MLKKTELIVALTMACLTAKAEANIHLNLYGSTISERNWVWGSSYYQKIDGLKSTLYPTALTFLSKNTSLAFTPAIFQRYLAHGKDLSGIENIAVEGRVKSKLNSISVEQAIILVSATHKEMLKETRKQAELGYELKLESREFGLVTPFFKGRYSYLVRDDITYGDTIFELKSTSGARFDATESLSLTLNASWLESLYHKSNNRDDSVGASISLDIVSGGNFTISPYIEYSSLIRSRDNRKLFTTHPDDSLEIGLGLNYFIF
ncbi:MAG: hypothetical protein HOE90_05085 [Bacteriovoracaceae bacterium]|jgi:hypothetical protein|nr:hypothetical protein [Bacteriovoracaceae bacterium]